MLTVLSNQPARRHPHPISVGGGVEAGCGYASAPHVTNNLDLS
eukprot:COSAG01_NODE_56583_length_317_cov_1.096330_2_plen_42_part_01